MHKESHKQNNALFSGEGGGGLGVDKGCGESWDERMESVMGGWVGWGVNLAVSLLSENRPKMLLLERTLCRVLFVQLLLLCLQLLIVLGSHAVCLGEFPSGPAPSGLHYFVSGISWFSLCVRVYRLGSGVGGIRHTSD